jgi:hypothetical protein
MSSEELGLAQAAGDAHGSEANADVPAAQVIIQSGAVDGRDSGQPFFHIGSG